MKIAKRTSAMSPIITKSIHNKHEVNKLDWPFKFNGSVQVQTIGTVVLLTATRTGRTLEHIIHVGLSPDDARHLIEGLKGALEQYAYLNEVNRKNREGAK